MITSESVSNIFKALCDVKKEFKTLDKNKKGYGYNYTTLDNVIELLNDTLPNYGLGFIQTLTNVGQETAIITRIIHETGEYIEDMVVMTNTEISAKVNDTQKLGASITYFRRYCLSTFFGIATEEDTDGITDKKTIKQIENLNNNSANSFSSNQPKLKPALPNKESTAPVKEKLEIKSTGDDETDKILNENLEKIREKNYDLYKGIVARMNQSIENKMPTKSLIEISKKTLEALER